MYVGFFWILPAALFIPPQTSLSPLQPLPEQSLDYVVQPEEADLHFYPECHVSPGDRAFQRSLDAACQGGTFFPQAGLFQDH